MKLVLHSSIYDYCTEKCTLKDRAQVRTYKRINHERKQQCKWSKQLCANYTTRLPHKTWGTLNLLLRVQFNSIRDPSWANVPPLLPTGLACTFNWPPINPLPSRVQGHCGKILYPVTCHGGTGCLQLGGQVVTMTQGPATCLGQLGILVTWTEGCCFSWKQHL